MKHQLQGLAFDAGVKHQRNEEESERTYSTAPPPLPPETPGNLNVENLGPREQPTHHTSRQKAIGLRHLPMVHKPSKAEEVTVSAGGGTLLHKQPLILCICPAHRWVRQQCGFSPGSNGELDVHGGQGHLVPIGANNRDQKPLICLGWWLQPGQKFQTFSSGWSHQLGPNGDLLVPVGATKRDQKTL